MVEMGGINLPRTISTMLGRNLGKIYKERGVTDQKVALTSMFKAMGGKKVSFEDIENGYIITTEFPTDFCSIGGGLKPKRYNMFVESICFPYAKGFLSQFNPNATISVDCEACVLRDPDNKCVMQVSFN